MSSRAAGARFRQRKLSTKHALQILHEDELLDAVQDEDDLTRQVPRVETGVERAEETEHHLQAVISASAAASLGGKVAQIYIPTPETKSSHIKYDDVYPKRFSQPATYIRFSSTVEDSIGPPYDASAEDNDFVNGVNESKVAKDGKLTLDVFEEVMSFFEATATARQPFSSIGNAPVLSFEELQSAYDETITGEAQKWTGEVYPHWHQLRLSKSNTTLIPSLKFETGAETDDADAYVCFRRREVRQVRKTRGRDAQVVEKIRKLRRELEEARQLVHSVNAREKLFIDRLETDKKVFEQRQELKRVKIQHGIKGERGEDEELLINQRPIVKPKARPDGPPGAQHRSSMLRLSSGGRQDRHGGGGGGGAPEQDLVQLDDLKEEAEAMIQRQIDAKKGKHRDWNRGFVDATWQPICPPSDEKLRSAYLPVVREVHLPTPPASVEGGDGDKMNIDGSVQPLQSAVAVAAAASRTPEAEGSKLPRDLPTPVSEEGGGRGGAAAAALATAKTIFRFASPEPDSKRHTPTFRRRYGRLGRLHIDAIRPRRIVPASEAGVIYDDDDGSDSDLALDDDADRSVVLYPVDYWADRNLKFRANIMMTGSRKPVPADVVAQHQHQMQLEQAARRSSANVSLQSGGGGGDVTMHGGGGTAGQAG